MEDPRNGTGRWSQVCVITKPFKDQHAHFDILRMKFSFYDNIP